MFDLIGDIHGHADKLEKLLTAMGYTVRHGVWQHTGRQVVFMGDYIDRGPKIKETLAIVRRMVETGNAIAIMGNHEYNAICFHYPETAGGHLRKHSIRNIIQHMETLKQFQNMQEVYNEYIDWFKTLPLFYENEYFRAVHACWDAANIEFLRNALFLERLSETTIIDSAKKGSRFYTVIEDTLKGKEMPMPEGLNFTDKDGALRTKVRIKWWKDPAAETYQSMSVLPLENLPDTPLDADFVQRTGYYAPDEKPVFFGHYWLKGTPAIYRNNVCCLDYSVAKDGLLVAYRYDGERELSNDKFIWV